MRNKLSESRNKVDAFLELGRKVRTLKDFIFHERTSACPLTPKQEKILVDVEEKLEQLLRLAIEERDQIDEEHSKNYFKEER